LSLAWTPDGGVDACVEDFGVWRPIPADSGFRGRGLTLIRNLAEGVVIEPGTGGGTVVRFHVPAAGIAGAEPDNGSHAALDEEARPVAVDGSPARIAVRDAADGGPDVVVSGELDLAAAEELRPELLAALVPVGGTVDLRGVSYLASAGVGLLLEIVDRVRAVGGTLRVVVHPDSAPARVLRYSGLEDVLGARVPAS
jgi:anti-anti-sigma factor